VGLVDGKDARVWDPAAGNGSVEFSWKMYVSDVNRRATGSLFVVARTDSYCHPAPDSRIAATIPP
jgi:hypothetical protein